MDKKQIKLADVACVDTRKMEGIEELAANIAALGLLQPILLTNEPEKSEGGKTYGVVDGRRRFRALEQLKREYLEPGQYVIFQGKVGQEKQAAFSANFARQQLTLQEEVEALKNLGGSRSSIAALLGKTEQWVALRQNLANLTGKWVDVLQHPEKYPHWSVSKLELLAREPTEVQKACECRIKWDQSFNYWKDILAGYHRLLSAAPFDTAGCMNCPKRSGAQGVLFADFDDKHDSCLDKKCFVKKALDFIKKLREKKLLIPVTLEYCYGDTPDVKYAISVKAKDEDDFGELRPPKKGEEPNAIVVAGNAIGRLMVAVPKKGDKKSTAAKTSAAEKTVAEREAELKAKRVKLALGKLKEWLKKSGTVADWAKRGNYDDKKVHASCVKLAAWFGIDGKIDYAWRWEKPRLKEISDAKFADAAFTHAVKHFERAVAEELQRTLADINVECGKDICDLLFLDWGELFLKPATAEIPEPKSLAVARIKEQQAKAEKKAVKSAKPAKASGK